MARFTITIDGDTDKDANILAAVAGQKDLGPGRLWDNPDAWGDRAAMAVLAEERDTESGRRRWSELIHDAMSQVWAEKGPPLRTSETVQPQAPVPEANPPSEEPA